MSVAASIAKIGTPPPFPVRRFTVEEYHRMIGAGVLIEDDAVELVEGWIVNKMPRNPPHDVAIALTQSVLSVCLAAGWHIRTQSAITTEDSEPEPDVAIVKGAIRDYTDRHPASADVSLLIEVVDSSLTYDRETKLRLYARAGVKTYWIVNLVDRVVEAFSDPSGPPAIPAYRRREIFAADQSVPLAIPGSATQSIAVRELLP